MASTGKLLRTYGRRWGNLTSYNTGVGYTARSEEQYVTVNQTYEAITSSEINFTTSVDNGVYLLMADLNIYLTPDNGNGSGQAFEWNGTRICGTDGASGDTWQRAGHGSTGNAGAWSVVRKFVYAPGLDAGTAVSAMVMVGQWGSVSARVNYGNYANFSDFTIWEFEPAS